MGLKKSKMCYYFLSFRMMAFMLFFLTEDIPCSTPLRQTVLDDNESAVILLVAHGADINKQDDDSWTPLHAACAEGYADIVAFLLEKGADKTILTDEGERPLDLVEPSNLETIREMLGNIQPNDNDQSDDDTLELTDIITPVTG